MNFWKNFFISIGLTILWSPLWAQTLAPNVDFLVPQEDIVFKTKGGKNKIPQIVIPDFVQQFNWESDASHPCLNQTIQWVLKTPAGTQEFTQAGNLPIKVVINTPGTTLLTAKCGDIVLKREISVCDYAHILKKIIKFYGPSVNFSKTSLSFQSGLISASFALGNRVVIGQSWINPYKGCPPPEHYAHEFGHIWQHQHGISVLEKGLGEHTMSLLFGTQIYNYGGAAGLRTALKQNKNFYHFGLEQQAELFADYFAALVEKHRQFNGQWYKDLKENYGETFSHATVHKYMKNPGKTIYSWNVNGIRAVSQKGFIPWIKHTQPDVLCLQETKAHPDQLGDELLQIEDYKSFFASANKKGYSGVAIYSKIKPLQIQTGIGVEEFDNEGRTLALIFDKYVVISAYFPNSQHDHARLDYKLGYCQAILSYCEQFRKQGLQVILCGDYNIAHKEIDLKNPKANVNNPGFLPEERAWMDQFTETGYIDSFRHFNQEPDHYTWWSYRFQAREKNIGWRIDYICTNPECQGLLMNAFIVPQIMGSDHCPIGLELNL